MKTKIRGAFRSRTMWFSLFVAIVGASVSSFPLLRNMIDAEVYSVTLFSLSVLYAGLRVVTTKPLEDR